MTIMVKAKRTLSIGWFLREQHDGTRISEPDGCETSLGAVACDAHHTWQIPLPDLTSARHNSLDRQARFRRHAHQHHTPAVV